MPGFFDNGPYPVGLIPKEPPLPPAIQKPRRNTVQIIARRICDGEEFTFHGWAEVERLGFDRFNILAAISALTYGNWKNYSRANQPYEGFTWEVIEPQTHELPPDHYMPSY